MRKNIRQYLGSLSLFCALSFSALYAVQNNGRVPLLVDQACTTVAKNVGEQIEQRVHGVDLKSISMEDALDHLQKIEEQVTAFQPALPDELKSKIIGKLCQTPTVRFLLYPVSNNFVEQVKQQSKDVTSDTLDATVAQIERAWFANVPERWRSLWENEYTKRVWRRICKKNVLFNTVAFAPDSRSCAYSSSREDGIHIMELPSCKKIKKLPCQGGQHVTFLPDGRLVSKKNDSAPMYVWEDDKCTELNNQVDRWIGYPYAPCSNGKFLGPQCIWDAQGNQYTEISVNPGLHNALSDDGTLFAREDSEDKGEISLHDVEKKVRKILRGHTEYVSGLAFVPKTKQLVSGSFDETMRVWDTQTGKCTHVLRYDNRVTGVAIARNDQLCISATRRLIHIWDPITWQQLAEVKSFVYYRIAIANDGSYIACEEEINARSSWKDTLVQAAIKKAESPAALEQIRASKTTGKNNSVLAPRIEHDLQEKLLALQHKN